MNLGPFGATWCRLVCFGATWCRLGQLGADWCRLVHFGASRCRLVEFGIIWGRLVQFGTSWFSHIGAVGCNLLQLAVCRFCEDFSSSVKYLLN